MPNKHAEVCGCGVSLEFSKSRNTMKTISHRTKSSKNNKAEPRVAEKEYHEGEMDRRTRSNDNGSCSAMTEQIKYAKNNTKLERRRLVNSSRRTRSAERPSSHYTYIDSSSSLLNNGSNTILEAPYATLSDFPNTSSNIIPVRNAVVMDTIPNSPQPVYSIPSMTSPPPTYDVAIAKSWQTGLPPSYEDYLCHKYATLSRSHTPPPPWSDSTRSINTQHSRRDLLTNETELGEYLSQLSLTNAINTQNPQVLRGSVNLPHAQQALRKHVKQQRLRAMTPRSLSETRAHQQRLATMCEDGAFCMETTAIQSAFENGVAFCCLM
ncbi:hypothetical protein PV327_006908 [Microctonus hyperodae]|uniref:Uncharacterized protein n=1 Tax=Microctonus hyperodae TaxID=165561 RepID=A0AA39F5E4_MICHY|nr:hypothetical protein PV327_006908 [Microctonus hyperodae]